MAIGGHTGPENRVPRKGSGSIPMASAIVHRIQPTPRSCGQTCLAMLLGVPVSDVFVRLVRTRGTTGRQLRRVLAAYNVRTSDELRYTGWLPPVALVRIEWPVVPRRGHWIVRANGRFYDPLTRDPHFAVNAGRIASYITIG